MHSTEISLLTEPEIADFLEAATQERGDAEWPRLAQFAQDMLKNERTLWVARQNGDYVGMVSVRWQSDFNGFRTTPPAPEVIDLYIWQNSRRQGIASALMDHVEQALRDRHYQRVGLSVGILPEDKPAHTLYLDRGYTFDPSGYWWQGRNVDDTANIDQKIAPVLLMMEKRL